MTAESFFAQAFVFLAAAVIAVPVSQRLGFGSVLGYLLAGVVIGPFGLGLVGADGEDIMDFAEFGVVMMLFLVGLLMQPRRLWELKAPILGLGGLQVGLTAVAFLGVAMALTLTWREGLAIGLILAMSSTAIALQMLSEKGLLDTRGGQTAFSVLLAQDIAIIPIIAAIPFLAAPGLSTGTTGDAGILVEGWPAWARALGIIGVVAAVILAGRFILNPLFHLLARTRLREVFTAAALLLVVGISLLMPQFGLSSALGAFLAGVVLAESPYRHELESDIEPFKGLLLGLFFIAVGASIDLGLILGGPLTFMGLVLGLIAIKVAVLLVLGKLFRLRFDQNLLFALSIGQGGEFCFVLFAFARDEGVLATTTTAPLVAAVAVSMALAPPLFLIYQRLLAPRFGTRETVNTRPADDIDHTGTVLVAGFGRFGHVVGRMLRAQKVPTVVLDHDSEQVEVLRKLGLEVYYGDATRHDLLAIAGAAKARAIVLALDDHKANLRLVATVRKHFPHLQIFARAHGRVEAYDLLEAGVTYVYRETLDTALELSVDLLGALGHRRYQAWRATRLFRRHDEQSVREMAAMRHESAVYFARGREDIESFERIMADQTTIADDVTRAWDEGPRRRPPEGDDGTQSRGGN